MFWVEFWPQLIATLIGLCLSIPITFSAAFIGVWGALLLDRRQENLQRLEDKKEAEKRKRRILDSLNSELDYNLFQLIIWDKRESGDFEAGSLGVKLRNETWRAFSEGGELEWIKSTKILWFLSDAYRRIRMVQEFSERHYNLTNFGQTGESSRGVSNYYKLEWIL